MNLIKREDPFENLAKKFFGGDDFFRISPSKLFMGENQTIGKANIIDNEKEYALELSVPGFKKEDININIDGDILTISSDFEDSKEESNDKYYRKEFIKSSFSRSFYVPEDVSFSKIDAKMEDGILNVSFPKKEKKKKDSKLTINIK